ncbi:hypothetical protein C3941_11185 [Kaistia algarum]|uniref:hypothetical protein n=1 Tax=Kaistia algarum TaxID=2083279 RepID=UPI000CE91AF1|nr:hypothetical protein [Kaistia algarum]MCX5514907.1 hypothetical protein [Kaistia algarum]PPE79659.1 hypothetical protein C3941_11185 [Kaistia algarum]
MRILFLSLAVISGMVGLSGCQSGSNPNSPAMQAMDNPPNSCGSGGSQNIEDCNNGGGRR